MDTNDSAKSFRGGALRERDGNIQRAFRLYEGVDFQVRVDAINLFNHTQFAPPNVDPLSMDFSRVTTNSSTVMRFLLFQGKFRS